MQSEEQITFKKCQYCGKEFRAWKPSLKLCSEACKKNKDFDSNLQILNALDKIKGKVEQAINEGAPNEPKTIPAQDKSEAVQSSSVTISKIARSIRSICRASKAKAKHIISNPFAVPEPIRRREPECNTIQPPLKKIAAYGIRHLCNNQKAKLKGICKQSA